MSDKSKKNKPEAQPDQAAWLQIYKAQKTRMPKTQPVSARGRPARIAALTRINTMISASDKALLVNWQAIFKMRTGRSLTLGEVAGLLAHICMARMEALGLVEGPLPESVDELVALLVGEGEGRAPGGKG